MPFPAPGKRRSTVEFLMNTGFNNPKIGVNNFVLRQTVESKFSHFDGTFERVVEMAFENFALAKDGYKDGVKLVTVPAEAFYSGVVEINNETELKATFEARRKGEQSYLSVVATSGVKLPAKVVELVLYRRDVLGNEASTPDAEWELISINARATEEEEPMTPVAMARNMLELPGGTKAEYTAEQFARAIMYWSTRAMRG